MSNTQREPTSIGHIPVQVDDEGLMVVQIFRHHGTVERKDLDGGSYVADLWETVTDHAMIVGDFGSDPDEFPTNGWVESFDPLREKTRYLVVPKDAMWEQEVENWVGPRADDGTISDGIVRGTLDVLNSCGLSHSDRFMLFGQPEQTPGGAAGPDVLIPLLETVKAWLNSTGPNAHHELPVFRLEQMEQKFGSEGYDAGLAARHSLLDATIHEARRWTDPRPKAPAVDQADVQAP